MELEPTINFARHSPVAPEPAGTEVVVRQYGLLEPLDWGDDCSAELGRMVDLWNALVEIERGARGQYQKIMQNDPAITETSAKISAVLCEQASLIARRTKMRASGQGKSYIAPINESLADLGGKLRELRRTAASLSKQVRVRVKNELRSVESSRRAEVKLARQGSGLWWGNYNAVVNAYEQARSRALREGGEIRAKTFDGSGRITNQIQGGMSVADLFGGGHSQVTVRPLPEDAWSHSSRGVRKRLQRTIITATIFTQQGERRTVSWPMIMHRPIPQDCRIKTVVVTRRRCEEGWRWQVVFTCTRDSPARSPAPNGQRRAVHLGWRRLPDGIRVATLASNIKQGARFFTTPNVVLEGFALTDSLRGKRQGLRDAALQWLMSLDWSGAPEPLAGKFRAIQPLPAATSRLVDLAAEWSHHSEWHPEAYSQFEKWRREDKRLRLWERNQRDKIIRRRNDQYRQFARDIVEDASSITINVLDLSALSRVDKPSGGENPLPAAARHYRTVAAISILRKFVIERAQKVGTNIIFSDAAKDRVCHSCQKPVNYAASPFTHQYVCETCGASFDKDLNSCRSMLMRVGTT
jgi:hypothetical protein